MIERDLKLLRVGDRANTLKVSGHADFVKEYDPTPPPLPRTVDCASAASPSYTVVDLGDDADNFLNTAKCPTAHGVTDLMLEQVLPYVTLDGKAVSKDQCFLWGLSYNTTTGPLLPIMHRDGQWSAFGESAGFQVWALCANSDETGKGNMMMVEHDEPEQARRSSAYFVTDEDGVVLKLNHATGELLESYPSFAAASLKLTCPTLKVGHALVWHRAQIHTSDPRPFVGARTALTAMFLVGQPGQTQFKVWHQNPYLTHVITREVRKGRGWRMRQPGWTCIAPTRTSLSTFDMYDEFGMWPDHKLNPMFHSPKRISQTIMLLSARMLRPFLPAAVVLLATVPFFPLAALVVLAALPFLPLAVTATTVALRLCKARGQPS